MARNTAGLKRGGSPGRPKGVPNKATKEVKELARRLVLDPEYQQKLRQRLLKGTLSPHVEATLWHYAFGKPKDEIEISVPREVIQILPPPSITVSTEVEPIDVTSTGLALPEEPPQRHLPPSREEGRTWGPSPWPRRR